MEFLEIARGAEVLPIASAIRTLVSSFNDGAELVKRLKTRRRDRRARSRIDITGLEQLEQCLVRANSTIQVAFNSLHSRYGEQARIGDDLSRFILFALTARQETLFKKLQSSGFEEGDIPRLIASIDRTKTAAATCLDELDGRIQRPASSPQLTLQDKTALLMDYQGLCSSAVLYRTGQAPHSQLAAISSNYGKSSCQQCRVTLIPSKISIPGADASSCVLINLSGLFRSHCKAGGGFTCIWQLRVPSCYGVFPDVKALLKHMLAVHVRDDGSGGDIDVDWPSDGRRGDLQKCGYSVRINRLQMRISGSNLVVPRRFAAVSTSSTISLVPSTRRIGGEGDYSKSSTALVTATEIDSSETEEATTPAPEVNPFKPQQRNEIHSNQIFELEATGSGQRPEVDSNELFEMDATSRRERQRARTWGWQARQVLAIARQR